MNRHHRYYTPSVWHSYYRVPNYQYCVIYKRPYRRYYTPIRYHYERPYRNNRRPTVYRNRRGPNRVANSRSNHSDRYKTRRKTTRSTANRSNTRDTSSYKRRETNTPNLVKRNKAVIKNSRAIAQRSPRVRSKKRSVQRR